MPCRRSRPSWLTSGGTRASVRQSARARDDFVRVCDEYVDRPIDFLKIDVELDERKVIDGGNWALWRPRVVLVEACGPEQWEPQLLRRPIISSPPSTGSIGL